MSIHCVQLFFSEKQLVAHIPDFQRALNMGPSTFTGGVTVEGLCNVSEPQT